MPLRIPVRAGRPPVRVGRPPVRAGLQTEPANRPHPSVRAGLQTEPANRPHPSVRAGLQTEPENRRRFLCLFAALVLSSTLAPAGRAGESTWRERAAAWIEAPAAEPAPGIDVGEREGASTGRVLGVHCDKVPETAARWRFALAAAAPGAHLLLRYAAPAETRLGIGVDGTDVGVVALPATAGWGHTAAEFAWGALPLGRDLAAGEHRLELRAVPGSRPVNLDCLAVLTGLDAPPVLLGLEAAPAVGEAVALAAWEGPAEGGEPFALGADAGRMNVWGGGARTRPAYFPEFLPAIFERTLVLDALDLQGDALEWVFTGERGGFTVRVEGQRVRLWQRYYDSFGLNKLEGEKVSAPRHPEGRWLEFAASFTGDLKAVGVVLDHRLGLSLLLNGRPVLRQTCTLDVSRHQLRVSGARGSVRGRLLRPEAQAAAVRIDAGRRYQTMLGFGGIATPTAYAELSPEGKRHWWELLCEYNLLIQREYPNGRCLAPDVANWDRLADAVPHYYGDNFPNGEISDFAHIKALRGLGGRVFFEFWGLPTWTQGEKGAVDPEAYARAMVGYCRASRERAGAPPDVVGIQNEVAQSPQTWHAMTLALRRALDAAGFREVRIHMSDAASLGDGIRRAEAFRRSREAWAAIDYGASHMYDYQSHFTDPDAFDAVLARWKEAAGGRPFLSTELCINSSRYQEPAYRLALVMGELYHKNLALADAAAICYCWSLLNVEQPSYGWTRTLFVPDRAHGFVPAASSHQARVFGAYSRRVREGMVRVEARCDDPDLLAVAFAGEGEARTLVLLNRAPAPKRVRVEGATFREMELVDPAHENAVAPAPPPADGTTEVTVEPGALLTLTTVPLRRLPEGFAVPE